jgi:hypothetical protein
MNAKTKVIIVTTTKKVKSTGSPTLIMTKAVKVVKYRPSKKVLSQSVTLHGNIPSWIEDMFVERDAEGYDENGYDWNGYDRNGFDEHGYDYWGYDQNGRDECGFENDEEPLYLKYSQH